MNSQVHHLLEAIKKHYGIAMAIGLLLTVASLGGAAFVIVRLPSSYFQTDHPPPAVLPRSPLLRALVLIGKNGLGLLLVVLGIVMSLPGVPGQGILTLLCGLMLLNFPGKRRLEQRLATRPPVWRS